MKVTITSMYVDEKPWNKGDRSGVIWTQEVMFEIVRMRNTGRLDLGKDLPHPVGEYICDLDDNFQINNFGDPLLARRLRLQPVAAAPRKAA
jgi:hypothetical protein